MAVADNVRLLMSFCRARGCLVCVGAEVSGCL